MTTSKQSKPEDADLGLQASAQSDDVRLVAINIALPVDLHRRLRIKAITEDMTMQTGVVTAIEEWVSS